MIVIQNPTSKEGSLQLPAPVALSDDCVSQGLVLRFPGRSSDPDPGVNAFRSDRSLAGEIWFHRPVAFSGGISLLHVSDHWDVRVNLGQVPDDIICLMICLNHFHGRRQPGDPTKIEIHGSRSEELLPAMNGPALETDGMVALSFVRTRVAWVMAEVWKPMAGRTIRDMRDAIRLL
ncbi:MAG: hypothetical protein ABJN42_20975 [Roseibium sp.]|uniref:hypothetical protein n=1 Tax=Roseibium sp. TaxID=1936156 RepID=UPI003298034A